MHQALYCLILHVSHCSDVSGWDHMSHVLMCQDETTCLMFWCVRMRPHVSCSDVSGWDHMSHVLMRQDETTCLTLFGCIGMRPHLTSFWCIRTRPHVSHCSDVSGRDNMSHIVLMYQDETTCLTLFWCIRTRPHVSHCSDVSGWDHMSHIVLMYQDETTCLTLFWCIRTRQHVSHCSDVSGRDHMSHIVLMYQDETTCLTLFWCMRMRPHVSRSDAGDETTSHKSASPTVLLLCTSVSSVKLCLSWCEPDYFCTLWNETLLQWLLYFMLPKCICFIHSICPCFLCLFRLCCMIVLMFHHFLQPNWCIHWKWILMFVTGVLVQLVTDIATVLHCCQSSCVYVQATLNWKQWALRVHTVALCLALIWALCWALC